ncbi:KAT8 regulatory NSL complex subunit 3-like [Pyrus ussuriensis x Pyrus communis]|uniref:KAT8 regulatory NSL complex subunit 3-like n=1 Tax=Pyrus ussuriensis x Pyrus communis TaxID=2448454 RepID=A0A5N5HZC1_9ROSA|nr:KAT8 regulatory NSL complex subunit 3-like [Pyrus ussuriensis x Pyrus communis]
MASSPPSKRRRKNQSKDETDDLTAASSSALEKVSPVVVFAHGAGAPSSSDCMISFVGFYSGVVFLADIPGGKKSAPPKAEKLVDFHADVAKKAVAKYPGHPLILAGKSMVSCMVACKEDIHASAIICLGYPLKGMNGAVRGESILQLSIPIMFVQASKDGLCPLEKLETTRKKMKCLSDLHMSLMKHLQTTGLSQDEAENLALQACVSCFFLFFFICAINSFLPLVM